MPLPGGETDKIGNRYEGRWTVFCMVDVMDEKADSIRLEKPGEDAFEFFYIKLTSWSVTKSKDKEVDVDTGH